MDDPLETSVEVAAQGKPVADLLTTLGRAGPIRLRAAQGAGTDRITAFARHQPLRGALLGISNLLGYTWSPALAAAPPGGSSLTRGANIREYEARLYSEFLESAASQLRSLVARTRAPAEAFQRLDESLGGQEPDDPLLRSGNLWYLSRAGPRSGLELFGSLSEQQRLKLLAEDRLFLPWTSMSRLQQRMARSLAENVGTWLHPGGEASEDTEWVEKFGVVMYASLPRDAGQLTGYSIGLGGPLLVCARFEPADTPDTVPVRLNPYTRPARSSPEVYADLETMAFPPRVHRNTTPDCQWCAVLEALSSSIPRPVFSDHFVAMPPPRRLQGGSGTQRTGLKLPEGLDRLCREYERVWWYKSGTVLTRRRLWFADRQYEVPPDELRSLSDQFISNGRLDPGGVATLARLTAKQLQGLSLYASETAGQASRARADLTRARAASGYLQIYSTLNMHQQRKVLDPDGLRLTDMSPGQREAFVRVLLVEHGRKVLSRHSEIVFRIQQSVVSPAGGGTKGRTAWLSFTYMLDEPSSAGVWIPYGSETPGGRSELPRAQPV
jgi:hypothetical protein